LDLYVPITIQSVIWFRLEQQTNLLLLLIHISLGILFF